MVEGVLILVSITSYCSIVKVCSEHRDAYGSRLHDNDWFWIMLVFGWFYFPFWVVYKFWEWLLVSLPKQIKEWSRKKK